MLLARLDRSAAERRVDEFSAGLIGRRELFARSDARIPDPPEPAPAAPAAERKPPPLPPRRRRPRTDIPVPRPLRSRGAPRINTEALGDADCLRAARWPDYFYAPDAQVEAIRRMDYFVLRCSGNAPPRTGGKGSPGG